MLRLAVWIFMFSAILYTLFGFELEGKMVSEHLGDVWNSPVCVEKRHLVARHVKFDEHWHRLRGKLVNYLVPQLADEQQLRRVEQSLSEAAGDAKQASDPKVIDDGSSTQAKSGLNHLIHQINKEH